MLRFPLAIASCLVALTAAGCGGGGGDSGGTAGALASRLPSDSSNVYYTDLDAVREDLGLDPDSDAIDVGAAFANGIDQGDQLQRLIRDAGTALPPLAQELGGGGNDPVLDALDGGEMHAIASTGPGEIQVSAIATSQDFGALADALAGQGYTRDGSVLAAASSSNPIGGIADTGEGVIVLARSEQQARDAADAGETSERAATLDAIGEPVRVAAVGMDCVERVGVGQAADATSGNVTIEVKGDANASFVDDKVLATALPGYEVSDPQTDGPELTIDYSGPAPKLETNTPLETLVQTFGVYSAYKCS